MDPRYQRQLIPSLVEKLARGFREESFGTPVVAERSAWADGGDDFFWMIDGQHRVEAKRRKGHVDFVAKVVKSKSLQHEATIFIDMDDVRRDLTVDCLFKAQLVAKERTAVLVNSMVEKSGLVWGKHQVCVGKIGCLARCLRSVRANETCFISVWPVIHHYATTEGASEILFASLFEIEKNLRSRGNHLRDSLSGSPWWERLVKHTAVEIEKAARNMAAKLNKGGERPWAIGVSHLLNHRVPQNQKIVWEGAK